MGRAFLTLIMFVPFFAALPEFGFGKITNSSVSWIVPLFLSVLLLSRYSRSLNRNYPILIYIPWALLVFFYVIVNPDSDSFQRAVMVLTPVLIGLTFSSLRFEKSVFKLIDQIFKVGAIALLVVRIAAFPFELDLNVPGLVMTSVLMASYFSYSYSRGDSSSLVWIVISILVPVLGVNRMAIAAGFVAIFFGITGVSLRKKILISILGITGIIYVLSLAPVQEKMFYSGQGSVTTFFEDPDDIRTHGRLVMWKPMWSGIKESPIFGHGWDRSTDLIVKLIPWIRHPHNDYLRLLYDVGLLGLSFYLISVLFQVLHLMRIGRKSSPELKAFMVFNASTFVPFMFLMITGNPILYIAFFGVVQYSLIGIGYSIYKAEKSVNGC